MPYASRDRLHGPVFCRVANLNTLPGDRSVVASALLHDYTFDHSRAYGRQETKSKSLQQQEEIGKFAKTVMEQCYTKNIAVLFIHESQ